MGWPAGQIIPVGILNGERMIAAISELRPDYLILAETGILSERTLALPGIGTLNAHPAILPFARGVGVVEHSLLRGIPAGVTTHFVETGIDTGAIVHRALIPVTPQDSLDSLRRKATTRCTELLVESIAAIGRGEPLASIRQTMSFPYCKRPSRAETAEASRLVRRGHARALYQSWRDHYQSDTLPPWDEAGPGTGGS